MEVLTFCFCALGIGMLISFIRRQSSETAPLAAAAGGIVLLAALLKYILPLLTVLQSVSSSLAGAGVYVAAMIKALGITLTSRACADVCRDCGESSVASKIESAGKIGILLIALPVLRAVITMLEQLVA